MLLAFRFGCKSGCQRLVQISLKGSEVGKWDLHYDSFLIAGIYGPFTQNTWTVSKHCKPEYDRDEDIKPHDKEPSLVPAVTQRELNLIFSRGKHAKKFEQKPDVRVRTTWVMFWDSQGFSSLHPRPRSDWIVNKMLNQQSVSITIKKADRIMRRLHYCVYIRAGSIV